MPEAKISNTNEPGATAGDHLLSAAVPTAVAVAAARDIPRLRARLDPATAPVSLPGRARPLLSTSH